MPQANPTEETLSGELSGSGWPASVWETVLIVNGCREENPVHRGWRHFLEAGVLSDIRSESYWAQQRKGVRTQAGLYCTLSTPYFSPFKGKSLIFEELVDIYI